MRSNTSHSHDPTSPTQSNKSASICMIHMSYISTLLSASFAISKAPWSSAYSFAPLLQVLSLPTPTPTGPGILIPATPHRDFVSLLAITSSRGPPNGSNRRHALVRRLNTAPLRMPSPKHASYISYYISFTLLCLKLLLSIAITSVLSISLQIQSSINAQSTSKLISILFTKKWLSVMSVFSTYSPHLSLLTSSPKACHQCSYSTSVPA